MKQEFSVFVSFAPTKSCPETPEMEISFLDYTKNTG